MRRLFRIEYKIYLNIFIIHSETLEYRITQHHITWKHLHLIYIRGIAEFLVSFKSVLRRLIKNVVYGEIMDGYHL